MQLVIAWFLVVTSFNVQYDNNMHVLSVDPTVDLLQYTPDIEVCQEALKVKADEFQRESQWVIEHGGIPSGKNYACIPIIVRQIGPL